MVFWLLDYRYGKERMEYVFLDSESQQLLLWKEEPREHFPYFYMRRPMTEEEKEPFGDHLLGSKFVKMWHPLEKRTVNLIRYECLDPQDVGSNAPIAITASQKELDPSKWSYEYYIRYYTRKTIDLNLTFGMPYEFKEGYPILAPQKDYRNDPAYTIMSDYPEELIQDLIPLFLEPLPDLKFMAVDIEVENRGSIIPDALSAAEPVVSVAIVYSDDRPARLLALRGSAREVGKERSPQLERLVKEGKVAIELFDSESPLLKRTFELLYEPGIPIIVDYNGDRFDLLYLAQRGDLFGIQHNISWRLDRKTGLPSTTDFKWIDTPRGIKIHLDLYQFFARRYIQGYAFKNAYKQLGLEDVAQALLKRGKIQHEGKGIAELSIPHLLYYNYVDALLLKLFLEMRKGVILTLIFLLMRIGVEPISECHRKEISSKLTNLFIRLCHDRGWIMPTKRELYAVGTYSTRAVSKDKQFEGAKVISPKPGVHFNVKGRDFASLYATTMKEQNISFETVNCRHPECMNNIVPETANEEEEYAGHWICIKDRGLAAVVIGFIRDIRVRYFKPLAKTDPWASAVEQMLKVLINASWGVFGAAFYDFHTAPAAESTISYARYSFNRLLEKSKELGMTPVIGDTDSVYNTGETPEIARQLEEFCKTELHLDLGLDYDLQFLGTTTRKKNYIGVTTEGEIIEKGVIAKKSHTPPIFREAAKQIYGCIKQIKDERSLIEQRMRIMNIIRKFNDLIWRKKGSMGMYSYFIKMTKRFSEYTKVTPMHVRAARIEAEWIMKTLPPGSNLSIDSVIGPGLLVSFVKGGKIVGSAKVKVTPVSIAKKADIYAPSYHKAFETMLNQIVEPLAINVKKCRMSDPFLGKLDRHFNT